MAHSTEQGLKLQLLAVTLIAALVFLHYLLWIDENGVRQTHTLRIGIQAQTGENAELAERNRALAAEIDDLKRGLMAIEERARSDMGMIRPDETFYRLLEKSQPPTSNKSTPSAKPAPPANPSPSTVKSTSPVKLLAPVPVTKSAATAKPSGQVPKPAPAAKPRTPAVKPAPVVKPPAPTPAPKPAPPVKSQTPAIKPTSPAKPLTHPAKPTPTPGAPQRRE